MTPPGAGGVLSRGVLSGSADASGMRLDLQWAVGPYLDRREPPQQLIVGAEGVRAVER